MGIKRLLSAYVDKENDNRKRNNSKRTLPTQNNKTKKIRLGKSAGENISKKQNDEFEQLANSFSKLAKKSMVKEEEKLTSDVKNDAPSALEKE